MVNRDYLPGGHCYWEKATSNVYIFLGKHEQDIRLCQFFVCSKGSTYKILENIQSEHLHRPT